MSSLQQDNDLRGADIGTGLCTRQHPLAPDCQRLPLLLLSLPLVYVHSKFHMDADSYDQQPHCTSFQIACSLCCSTFQLYPAEPVLCSTPNQITSMGPIVLHSQTASLGTGLSPKKHLLTHSKLITNPLCAQQLAELSVLLCVPVSREASAQTRVWALLLASGPAAGERSIVGRGNGCPADPWHARLA